MDPFADRLRGLRGLQNQTDFAARLGLKQAIYSHYETGRKAPSIEVLVRIAQKLGESTDYLLGLTDRPQSITTASAGPAVQIGGSVGVGNFSGPINAPVNVTVGQPTARAARRSRRAESPIKKNSSPAARRA